MTMAVVWIMGPNRVLVKEDHCNSHNERGRDWVAEYLAFTCF